MGYVDIKFKSDFRKVFQKDEHINLELKSGEVLTLVGNNGSGKSTMIDLIRAHKCDNNNSMSLNESNLKDIKEVVDFDTDFEKIYIVAPMGHDDPMSMMNTYDAVAYIELGGWTASRVSNGQRHTIAMANFVKKYKTEFDEKTLIIFDEVDTGFDLKSQALHAKLLGLMAAKSGAAIVNVTHSMLVMKRSEKVWSMDDRNYVNNVDEYIETLL